MGLAPPKKSRRPAGFPEASSGPATGFPAPVEEDNIQGGWDEEGMAPEFVVTIPEALEDLNWQPTTMDRDLDSPHPASPRQAASLDSAVEVIMVEGQEEDPDTEILREVPSTQPASPPLPREPSPRVILEPLQHPAVPRGRGRSRPARASASPPAPQVLTSTDNVHPAGRGILRLHAPSSAHTGISTPTSALSVSISKTVPDTAKVTIND